MTISEKVEAYFDELAAGEKLRPGDRLPKYEEIGKLFHIPYASVQRALKTMEAHGKVKIINGVGSFLNGGDTLDVDIFITPTTFPLPAFRKIADAVSKEFDLHLNIRVADIRSKDFRTNVTEHKVVLTESDPWRRMDGCMMDYSFFPDYEKTMKEFVPFQSENENLGFPFFRYTYQAAVNLDILEKTGMSDTIREISGMTWWKDAVNRCRAAGYSIASLVFDRAHVWSFPIFTFSVMRALYKHPDVSKLFKIPFYNTDTGKEIFDMCGDMAKIQADRASFFEGNELLSFFVGSWFPVQSESLLHVNPESFRILPIRTEDGRQILRMDEVTLKTFANPSITRNEKERIWKFLKGLLSKKYQKKLSAISGTLSPRRDMRPSDYAWNTRSDYMNFFPEPDAFLYNSKILSKEATAVLGTLYEQYAEYGADSAEIRRRMDEKLQYV